MTTVLFLVAILSLGCLVHAYDVLPVFLTALTQDQSAPYSSIPFSQFVDINADGLPDIASWFCVSSAGTACSPNGVANVIFMNTGCQFVDAKAWDGTYCTEHMQRKRKRAAGPSDGSTRAEVLSVEEAAAFLHLPLQYVEELIKSGSLMARQFHGPEGTIVRVLRRDCMALFE